MLDRPSIAVKKSVVMLAGAVLAMIAMLVISSPAPTGIFAHPHDPGETHTGVAEGAEHIHYAEDAPGPVRDFDSTDPEMDEIEWSVRGVDAADFDIDSSTGVLTFIDSPDYENPTDRGLNLNPADDSDFTDGGEFAPGDRNYQITVSATEMSDALPAKRTDIALTVVVDNADDKGEVTLQWLQPEVDTPIRATLTDPDGNISGSTWTWSISKVGVQLDVTDEDHWNAVTGGGFTTVETPTDADADTVSSYTPQGDTVASDTDSAVDEGDHLRVKVDYTDEHGAGKTLYGISMNPVRAEVSSPGDNGSPDFGQEEDTRTVPESTAVGESVGLPVTAIDPDNDPDDTVPFDTVTYELDDDTTPGNTPATRSDLQFFDINMETGQIEVAQELDYDAVGEGRADDAEAGTYTVIVRATDPSGLADNITVTITAENVNEDPVVTGRAELSVAEGTIDITDEDAELVYTRLLDAPGIGAPSDPTHQLNEYVYEEPDHLDSIARWYLEGDDAGVFDHSGRFEPRYLQFKVAPDYENPTDMNRDNVYEVTLVATDTDPLGTGAGIGKVRVWLTVTNVEEAGMVVFTEGETAFLDEMLVAEVQDPDDHGGDMGEPYQGVHIVNWQWSKSQRDNDPVNDPFVNIVGATTNMYTPKDTDRGFFLRATARYTDPLRIEDLPGTEIDERLSPDDPDTGEGSLRVEMATTENAVSIPSGPESAPTFPDTTGAVTRKVAEETAPGGKVGVPVTAMAANLGEALEYKLEGTDAKYFNIDDMGQITVGGDDPDTEDTEEAGTDPELNYDPPDNHRMFSVTVKVEVANGEANQKAEVDVNIMVTPVDEELKITDEDVDEPPVTGIMYPEINEDDEPNTEAVATYVVTDPEGDSISWDLRGADAALFTIDGGVLKFRNAPDYENPRDMDGDLTDGDHSPIDDDGVDDTVTPDAVAGNNVYDIVIRAIASRDSGDTGPAETVDRTVAVTVTDVDEDGKVVISWLQPEVGTEITASLTDPDGPENAGLPVTDTAITPTGWTWEVSKVRAADLKIDNPDHWGPPGDPEGDTDASYTPVGADLTDVDTGNDTEIDEGKFLRVTASYSKDGVDRTAHAMSAYPVQARGGGDLNGSPDFKEDKVDRSVAETVAVGEDVGFPVEASLRPGDDSKDKLTYGLRAVAPADLGSTGVALPTGDGTGPGDDLAAFDIDKASGQITVAQKLDFESRGPADEMQGRDGKYVVVVEVFDPSANTDPPTTGYDFVVVVITAEDMNEDPVLSGRPELTIMEIDSSDEDADNPDFDGNPVPPAEPTPTVNVYGVVDEDHRAATDEWALEGEDKDQFQLIRTEGRTLVFRNQPDYENPADANGDNVYKVTVVTFDGDGGEGRFDVCIAVMNIDEAGKITLLDEDGNELVQPRAHGPITAELTDPDGGVTRLTWQWAKADDDPLPAGTTAGEIGAADSATYTPTNDDTGSFLHVTATYADLLSAVDDVQTGNRTPDRMETEATMHAVLEVLDLKRAPAFPEEHADGVEREIAENSPSTTYVGEVIVAAVDPDKGTTLTYTLEGEEAKFFKLVALPVLDEGGNPVLDDQSAPMMVNTRQIVVADPLPNDEDNPDMWDAVDLNHEDDEKNSYTVMLKASDGALDDTLTVTITVTDRNEAPSTPMEATDEAPTPDGNNAPEFAAATDTREVAENTAAGENIGAPVEATDADTGDTLTYELGGTDMASFAIDGATGQLKTMAALDFEMPADADTDNDYEVTVTASDGTAEAMVAVTITVTDMGLADSYDANEDGMIDGTEVLNAVEDYFNDVSGIDSERILDIVELYFSS